MYAKLLFTKGKKNLVKLLNTTIIKTFKREHRLFSGRIVKLKQIKMHVQQFNERLSSTKCAKLKKTKEKENILLSKFPQNV